MKNVFENVSAEPETFRVFKVITAPVAEHPVNKAVAPSTDALAAKRLTVIGVETPTDKSYSSFTWVGTEIINIPVAKTETVGAVVVAFAH